MNRLRRSQPAFRPGSITFFIALFLVLTALFACSSETGESGGSIDATATNAIATVVDLTPVATRPTLPTPISSAATTATVPATIAATSTNLSTVTTVPAGDVAVIRTLDMEEALPGETVVVHVEAFGIQLFFAVREDLDGLTVVSHTADNLAGGTFVLVGSQTFSYTVKIPEDAVSGSTIQISGQFWQNPGDRFNVSPQVSTIRIR